MHHTMPLGGGTAGRARGELFAEIARLARLAQIARPTAKLPTTTRDHHHPLAHWQGRKLQRDSYELCSATKPLRIESFHDQFRYTPERESLGPVLLRASNERARPPPASSERPAAR